MATVPDRSDSQVRRLVIVVLAVTITGCRFILTAPSPIVTVNNANTSTNTNNNDNVNHPPPPTPGNGSPPGIGNVSPVNPQLPRAPDPPAGGVLPYPASAEPVVKSIAATHPQLLAQSCVDVYGPAAWAFLDKVIDTLRQTDTRWGYVCKAGNCVNISGDVIAYHATGGPSVQGALGTWEIDIIQNHCPGPGMSAAVSFQVHAFAPTNVWGTRGRF
jgi:hypothetical protein